MVSSIHIICAFIVSIFIVKTVSTSLEIFYVPTYQQKEIKKSDFVQQLFDQSSGSNEIVGFK